MRKKNSTKFSITEFSREIEDPTTPLIIDELLPDLGVAIMRSIAAKTESVIEFSSTSVFTTLSLACANYFRIQPNSQNGSYLITPNLSGIIIAKPGSRKSAPVQLATKPLKELEKNYAKELAKSSKQNVTKQMIQSLNNEALKKEARKLHSQLMENSSSKKSEDLEKRLHQTLGKIEDKSHSTHSKILMVQDPTQKGLLKIAESQKEPVLIFKDEMAPFLEEIYSSKNSSFRRYLIEAMDGKCEYTNVTALKSTISVQPPVISLLGTTQPSVIKKLMNKFAEEKIVDDGYLDRLQLLSYPNEIYVEKHDGTVNSVDEDSLSDLEELLEELYEQRSKKSVLQLTNSALTLLNKFKDKVSDLQQSDSIPYNVKNKLSKYPDMMLSIALVIAVFDHYEDKQTISTLKALNSYHIKLAEEWVEHYFKHLKKLWGYIDPTKSNAFKVLSNINNIVDDDNTFTSREITQKNWSGINRDSTKTKAALELLAKRQVIKKVNSSKASSRSERWKLLVKITE